MKASKATAPLAGLLIALSIASAPVTALATQSEFCDPQGYTSYCEPEQQGDVYVKRGWGGYTVYIKSKVGNRYLDMDCAHIGNCGNAQIWEFNGTNAQKWKLEEARPGVYKIRNVNSNRILSVANNSHEEGAQVWQYDDWNDDHQLWMMIGYTDKSGVTFINCATGRALDVTDGSSKMGTRIRQLSCHGDKAQRWDLHITS